jgi:hemoglobin-like flavoprotein
MGDDEGFEGRLEAGPLDGATLGLDVDPEALPSAMVVNVALGEDDTETVWHSYVLDRSRSRFRYLGEDSIEPGGTGAERLIDGPRLTRRFYELLTQRHPEVGPMFQVDLDHQAVVLHTAMRAVIHHLEDADWLVERLGSLGHLHAALGVTPEMYDAFTECMVDAMAEAAGDDWTPQLAAEWRGALDDIGAVMQAGASTGS